MAPRLAAVFLDRDGVLIEDRHYLSDPDGVALIPGARALVERLAGQGVQMFIVTNQSGVARGLFPLGAVDAVHERMFADLGGNRFAGVAICPHHPQGSVAEFTQACACRKPAPGMIERFLAEFALDPATCCMIGDKASDVAAGEAAGMRGYRFTGGDLADWFERTIIASGDYDLAQ